MPITLGINVQSLASQKRLADASDASARLSERLASGLRINRASDDAAGLAISESLRTDARVYSQGIRNFNDGISLLTMADAAIDQLIGITIRIAELAEQSANGTYGAEQRKASDAEAQALSKEFFRISRSTEFNGIGLFDGELSQLTVQGGYGSDGMISSSIGGALGTGEFKASGSYAVGQGPHAVSTGDFNGDGKVDLVAANENNGTVSILIGRGDGTFNSQVAYGMGGTSPSVAVGDLNRDGIQDLVSPNSSNDTVYVTLGRGDGTFGPAKSYSTGVGPSQAVLSDLNGDGILDITTADYTSDAVSILLGNGDGTFKSRQSFSTSAEPTSLVTGDINRDGIEDIVTGHSYSTTVNVLLGQGGGSFSSATSYTMGAGPSAPSLGDLNGDGLLDLVTADSGSASLSVRMGQGNGTFGSMATYTTGSNPTSVHIGDFNGDGTSDLVTADSTGMSILLGQDNGTFSTARSFATGTGSSPLSVSTGDFNGDGVIDLASADVNNDSVSILLGTTREGINPLLSFSLKTMADAKQALSMIQKKREQLSSQRGTIGALQARLTVGVSTLSTKNENYLAAASRVRDIDVAQDAAEAVRLRILKETGVAILSQANQIPTLALTLLRS